MEERNVGTKEQSPKEGLTSVEDLTPILPRGATPSSTDHTTITNLTIAYYIAIIYDTTSCFISTQENKLVNIKVYNISG